MGKLVFYWYWPRSDTYCPASPYFREAFDDLWRIKYACQAGVLATVVV